MRGRPRKSPPPPHVVSNAHHLGRIRVASQSTSTKPYLLETYQTSDAIEAFLLATDTSPCRDHMPPPYKGRFARAARARRSSL